MSTIKPRLWRATSPAACALGARRGAVVPSPAGIPAATPLSWMVSRRGLVSALVAAVMALVLVPAVSTPVSGAEGDAVVRITARRVADERVEFALQQRQPDDTWGDRLLPRQRLFPADTAVGRWLVSTPLGIDGHSVRIVARRVADERVEFALQQRQPDGTWSERVLPRQRFFPADTAIGRWLVSTPLTLSGAPTTNTGTAGDDAIATCASFFRADSEQQHVDKMCRGAAAAPNTVRFVGCQIVAGRADGWTTQVIDHVYRVRFTPPVSVQVGTRIELHSTCDRYRSHYVYTVTGMLPAVSGYITACRQHYYPGLRNTELFGSPYREQEEVIRVQRSSDGNHRVGPTSGIPVKGASGDCLP